MEVEKPSPVTPPSGTEANTFHLIEDVRHNLFIVKWISTEMGWLWVDGTNGWTASYLAEKGFMYFGPVYVNVFIEGVNAPTRKT